MNYTMNIKSCVVEDLQGNSLSSNPMTSSSQGHLDTGLGMQSSVSARKRMEIPYESENRNNSSSSSPSDCGNQHLYQDWESAAQSRDRKVVQVVPQLGLISKCLGCIFVQRESKSSDLKGVSGI